MHDATDVAVPRRTCGRRGISGKRPGSLAKADRVGEEARTASAERNADSEALQNKQIGDEQRDCRRTVLRCFDFAARAHSPSKLFTDLVKVNGDAEKLWKNWSSGLHRQTCYEDITKELRSLCKYKDITMINEAV
jgi:hypothetical protein